MALLISVTLHEAGHFVTARRFGMKASQFFVGFGPTIWSRQKGETEYGFKAIPAGGFVKIIGMTTLEEVDPADADRAFWRQPARRRVVVLSAGSFMHFVIAALLVFGTTLFLGVGDASQPVISAPRACMAQTITSATTSLPSSTPNAAGVCPAGTIASPAFAAGLRSGDRIVSAGGVQINDYTAFTKVVRSSAGQPLALVVQREGKPVALTLTPAQTTRPDLDNVKVSRQVGAVGVGQDTTRLRHIGPVAAFGETGSQLKTILVGTYDTLTKKLGTITGVYSENRDPAGFVGIVGVSRVSGEVFDAPIPFASRLAGFLLLIAGLNLFVGIFNLLPLLPLDGGHIAVLLYEQARDRVRRMFGYAGELKRVDLNKLLPVTYAVVIFFAAFTVFLMGADIVNPIKLGG